MKNARMLVAVAAIVAWGQMADAQEPSRDELRMAVQQICPISGERLGAHGPPVKAKVGEETVFVCCEACLKRKIDAQHWATIHANFARAQGICPVMKKPLPANAKSAIVEGQVVYVCCPPCANKIAADAAAYLRQIDQLYAASLQAQRQAR